MTAWKEGCKGITIYRDNCRTGVLITDSNKKQKDFKQYNAPKRPKTLEANIHTTKVRGKEYTVLVGILNGKPYEVFAMTDLTVHAKEPGTLTKISRGHYEFKNDKFQIAKITENMSDEEQAITRLISASLRHGADIKFIVEQLNKTNGDLTQFSKGISRVLKLYLKDEKVTGQKCPECNLTDLAYKDGCIQCLSCGYSKCG